MLVSFCFFIHTNNGNAHFFVKVPIEQNGEPGWLAGEIRGHTGWFPESYVEPIDKTDTITSSESTNIFADDLESKHLEYALLFLYKSKSFYNLLFLSEKSLKFLN